MLHILRAINNNTADNSFPHYQAHRSYIVNVDKVDCHYLMELDWNEICYFVKANPICSELTWNINWLKLMFCDIKMDNASFITMISLILGVILLFMLSLIIIAFIRLAPSFIAVSHFLKFDEHTAGSVLLLLVSYAGDVIENAQIFTIETTTAFNEALGAAMMTVGLVGGLLAFNYQFCIFPSYIVRDTVFILCGLLLTTIIYIDRQIYFHFALVFMSVYILFLISVLVEFGVAQARYRRQYNSSIEVGLNFTIEDMISDHRPIKIKFEVNDSLQYGELDKPNAFLFKQFMQTINPLRLEIMQRMNKFYKCCFVVGIPLHVICILCIPCYDYTLPNHGWSKLTTCINLIFAGPILTILFTTEGKYYIYTWIPGFILAIAVFCTSRTDRPPKYHIAFAFLALVICACFQFMLERELMSVLHMLGIVCGIRRETTALSFLAWADNIGLVVWVFRLAEWGYPKIGFAATYCAPLIDMIYCLGLMFTIKLWGDWKSSIQAFEGLMGPTSAVYIILLYAFIFFGISLCKFQFRKSLGVSCLIIYATYILQAMLTQLEIIHGYGTDHTSTKEKVGEAKWT